ncbi:hypothetical protein OROGR_003323 [Orobanche gracilis]
MESLTPKQGQNPSGVLDYYKNVVVQSLQNLGLRDVINETKLSNTIKRQPQKSPVQTQGHPLSDRESIWGYRFFDHEGDSSGAVLNHEQDGAILDRLNYHQFMGIKSNGPYNYYYYADPTDNDGPVIDLTHIEDILRGEHCLQKETLIYTLQSFVVTLMIDNRMHPIFQALLDACQIKQHLDSLIGIIMSESKLFIDAAFCRQGRVNSIVKLIRKLKRSNHAFTMTRILSTRFVEIMTDHTARQVIQTCFIMFSHEPNEIFYEGIIIHCHYLATHKVGCRSLNDCISTIAGEQRSRLLDNIADSAHILCDDPYGNYVLQNVLALNNRQVNKRIFNCLLGHFVVLAKRKVGSHTVEKCMEISELWLLCVIGEILKCPQTPQVLAQHLYGNYIIQKALRMTKERGLNNHYNALVNSLEPHFPALERTSGGRNVINVIKECFL